MKKDSEHSDEKRKRVQLQKNYERTMIRCNKKNCEKRKARMAKRNNKGVFYSSK